MYGKSGTYCGKIKNIRKIGNIFLKTEENAQFQKAPYLTKNQPKTKIQQKSLNKEYKALTTNQILFCLCTD